MSLSENAKTLFHSAISESILSVELIANSASNRRYFRIVTSENSYILTESDVIDENESFFYFNTLFAEHGILVPKLIAINEDKSCYIQEDIGNQSLLDRVHNHVDSETVTELYKQSILQLARLQIQLKHKIDYTKCYDFMVFDEKTVLNDLFYFKNYFLDRLDLMYHKSKLIEEFQLLAHEISLLPNDYFLYRDFQGRNIFIKDNKPYFIDFQGGMKGFPCYDLVSLIWQAKAQLTEQQKLQYKNLYFEAFSSEPIPLELMEKCYSYSLLLRILQLFGAYGLRGLVEKKKHFIESISYNIQNLQTILQQNQLEQFPYLEEIAEKICTQDTQEKIKNLI